MSIYASDEEREQRLHLWLCVQAHESVEMAMGKMRKIEIDRARQYGRTDSIAREAHLTANKLRALLDDITKVDNLIEKETKRRK